LLPGPPPKKDEPSLPLNHVFFEDKKAFFFYAEAMKTASTSTPAATATASWQKRLRTKIAQQPAWLTGLMGLLAFLPIPFGSNRPWASALMGVWVGVLLALERFDRHEKPPRRPLPWRRLSLATGLFAAVLVWGAIQATPWTPVSWHHPLWAETAALTQSNIGAISLAPSAATDSLIRLLAYAGLFLLALRAGLDAAIAYRLLRVVTWTVGAVALYGLIVQLFGGTTILWYKKWAYEGFLSATFVNKNTFATYAGLGLTGALALLWRRLKHAVPRNAFQAPRARWVAMVETLGPADIPVFLLPVLLLTALVLSGSRAGFVAGLFGTFVFLLGLVLNRRWSGRKGLGLLAGALLLVALVVAFGQDGLLLTRTDDGQVADDVAQRLTVYRLTWNAIAANPWLGFGLGAFEPAFRLYRDASVHGWFEHVHNDYLEAAFELGVPAALALLAALLLLISSVAQGAINRRRREIFPLVALAASVGIGVHSLVDFGLQIPAIAGTFSVLLGLGVAQACNSAKKEK
jgi:O-antigen ligase